MLRRAVLQAFCCVAVRRWASQPGELLKVHHGRGGGSKWQSPQQREDQQDEQDETDQPASRSEDGVPAPEAVAATEE
jgi:hypothetical protein